MNTPLFQFKSNFLLLVTFCSTLLPCFSNPQDHSHNEHPMIADSGMRMPEYPWRDPKTSISQAPATMGKQLGTVQTLNVPPLGYELDGNIKVFTLIAQPVERVLTKGEPQKDHFMIKYEVPGWRMDHSFPRKAKLWGFNGEVPGPTIECFDGDHVRIIVKNELPEPTSIHWHGIEVPNSMDGAGGHTEVPILPGETRIYEFTLNQVGTYMYHTGYNFMKQEAMGLGGIFVIHPSDDSGKKIDKDYAIMLQSFVLLPGNDFPDLVSMDFNWFTFNGKVAPDIDILTAKEGDRVRIRFANLSMDSHPIHLHGHIFKIVGTEGGPIPETAQWPGSTVNVPPGSTRDIEFTARPGVWHFHCHKVHHTMNSHAAVPLGVMPEGGMVTFLHVLPRDPDDQSNYD